MTTLARQYINKTYRELNELAVSKRVFARSGRVSLYFSDGSRIAFKDGLRLAYGKTTIALCQIEEFEGITKTTAQKIAARGNTKAPVSEWDSSQFITKRDPIWSK